MEFAELINTPKLDGVILHTQTNEPVDGTLCITGHHLILSSRREGVQELWLLHQCIDLVERKPIVNNNILQGGLITLKCKDLRSISLEINKPQEYLNVANSIEQLSSLNGQWQNSLYIYFNICVIDMTFDVNILKLFQSFKFQADDVCDIIIKKFFFSFDKKRGVAIICLISIFIKKSFSSVHRNMETICIFLSAYVQYS